MEIMDPALACSSTQATSPDYSTQADAEDEPPMAALFQVPVLAEPTQETAAVTCHTPPSFSIGKPAPNGTSRYFLVGRALPFPREAPFPDGPFPLEPEILNLFDPSRGATGATLFLHQAAQAWRHVQPPQALSPLSLHRP